MSTGHIGEPEGVTAGGEAANLAVGHQADTILDALVVVAGDHLPADV